MLPMAEEKHGPGKAGSFDQVVMPHWMLPTIWRTGSFATRTMPRTLFRSHISVRSNSSAVIREEIPEHGC